MFDLAMKGKYEDNWEPKWVAVDDLLEKLENDIERGNILGENGFSAAMWISDLKKELIK